MPRQTRRVALGPLMGANSTRITDRALQGTYMRGGYNVELRDGEWWTRQGEVNYTSGSVRLASCPWWWVFDVNRDLTVIANPWWAFALTGAGVLQLYTSAVAETVSVTNGSATATSSTTRVVDQIMKPSLSGSAIYRVVSRTGTTMTLDRPYEDTTNASLLCQFIDPLARNVAGSAVAYSASTAARVIGSAVLFEQLVSHTAGTAYAAEPDLTAGNLHLVITSNVGVPVAIDLSAYIAGSVVGVRRTFFYNTALASPAQVGSDTQTDGLYPRGVWADVYKGRLFIGAASDPNGKYGSRTVWWSNIGDLGKWHTGIAGQTAAPNFKTFDGDGNAIAEMRTLQDDLIIHRETTQVVCSITGSAAQPFTFRENNQGLGISKYIRANSLISADGRQFIWTQRGLAQFDGRGIVPLAQEALNDLVAYGMAHSRQPILHMQHDSSRQRIYVWSADDARHQDALPATATVTGVGNGVSHQNYVTVFVYDYRTGAYWFEDRPYTLGGGMVGRLSNSPPLLYLSRPDGTIVTMVFVDGFNTGQDCSHLDPADATDNVTVNAQIETPWLSFGSMSQKQLREVRTIERSATSGGGEYEDTDGGIAAGTWWLRCRVYSDSEEATSRGDVGTAVASSSLAATFAENRQPPPFSRLFTPRVHGEVFKLVFSNALTASATTDGHVQAPFRIQDIVVEFTEREGTSPISDKSGASISE